MSNNGLISRALLMAVPNVRKVTEYDEAGYGISYNAVPLEAIENAPSVDVVPKDFLERCMDNLVNELLAVLDAAPKWISVQDRLPEAHDDGSVDAVLVTDGSVIHMAYFNHDTWHFCESGEMKEEMFYNVTHWMPLPEPPKEDEEQC